MGGLGPGGQVMTWMDLARASLAASASAAIARWGGSIDLNLVLSLNFYCWAITIFNFLKHSKISFLTNNLCFLWNGLHLFVRLSKHV